MRERLLYGLAYRLQSVTIHFQVKTVLGVAQLLASLPIRVRQVLKKQGTGKIELPSKTASRRLRLM